MHLRSILLLTIILVTRAAHAQRRTSEAAVGAKAEVVFRADFEKDEAPPFKATGFGSAEFLKATMPEALEKAAPKGFAVRRVSPGIAGSKSAMEIARTGADKASCCAEKYLEWGDDDTTIAFAYCTRQVAGDDSFYVQAWGHKANKNLHAYINLEKDGTWQVAKISARSLVGFGGGAWEPGETFGSLMFVATLDGPDAEKNKVLIDNVVIYKGQDGTPPSAPATDVAATYDAAEKCVRVKWTAAVDDIGILGYEIHRGDAAGFIPSRDNRVGTAADTVFDDLSAEAGKDCFYLVVARDVGGNRVNSKDAAYKAVAGAVPAAAPAARPDF